MANYLASIFGTEADKVNCSFYYKIGACRHGDRCSRKHVKPSYSQTILLPNLYQNPAYDPKNKMNASQLQNHFDAFYEDFWCEMCKFGEIEEVVVCDNNNDREFLFFPRLPYSIPSHPHSPIAPSKQTLTHPSQTS
jgi:splicing factor U2AF subunit